MIINIDLKNMTDWDLLVLQSMANHSAETYTCDRTKAGKRYAETVRTTANSLSKNIQCEITSRKPPLLINQYRKD